jgi:hypothetical protein
MTAYDELCCYTLSLGDPEFIHQHVVDAYAAQTATADDKPIRLAFALVGLYLHLERGFTGKQVQLAHMKLAQRKQEWPRFDLPEWRGNLTAADPMDAPPGAERDAAIKRWCQDVWLAYESQKDVLVSLLRSNGVL